MTSLDPGTAATLVQNELDLARAMAAGGLPSPQRIGSMAMFCLRITGTGLSYRQGLDEHVWRNAGHYLNPEFLARCAGLPVLLEHPAGQSMRDGDFADRAIGVVFYPYIAGSEVWAVAKIYDAAAAQAMESEQVSTSPCVVFRDETVNDRLQSEDGTSLLFEGNPSLIDHVAIVERGVWDKQGAPSGVRIDSAKGKTMADETEGKENDGGDDRLDKVLTHLAGLSGGMEELKARLDALESKGVADAAKKDEGGASEVEKAAAARKAEERGEARDDKKRSDSFTQRRADDAALAKTQGRADGAFNAHGKRAPMPLVGETPLRYRVRMASELRRFSPALAKVNLGAIADADEAGFSELEDRIYADSAAEAAKPTMFPDDAIQCRERYDRDMGRTVREYHGPFTYVKNLGLPGRPVLKINTPGNNPGAFLQ